MKIICINSNDRVKTLCSDYTLTILNSTPYNDSLDFIRYEHTGDYYTTTSTAPDDWIYFPSNLAYDSTTTGANNDE